MNTYRSALYVDFDNVYLGLSNPDPNLALRFAQNPDDWVESLATGASDDGHFRRRFLVKACYINPAPFAKFRPFFTRAGFRVVDCPSLTRQGKSSADINLVLDAVGVLDGKTHYDEFVFASADADFTPLALKCREADRRVTIITAGPTASAYRSVADTVIIAESLVGGEDDDNSTPDADKDGARPAPAPSRAPRHASSPATRAVLQLLHQSTKPVVGSRAAQVARAAEPELATTWGGHKTFFAWVAAAVPGAEVLTQPAPGYLWDASRFTEAEAITALGSSTAGTPFGPDTLMGRVTSLTDVPRLTKGQFGRVLRALSTDLAAHPFDRVETSKRVRDACTTAKAPVGRATVNFIIQGLSPSGVLHDRSASPQQLATAWVDNVEGLCQGIRMELAAGERTALRIWAGGGLAS